jgi:hypothetical protein
MAAQRPEPPGVGKSSLQGQEYEKRLRIAERLVQTFRLAGYSCELGDGGHSKTLKRLD